MIRQEAMYVYFIISNILFWGWIVFDGPIGRAPLGVFFTITMLCMAAGGALALFYGGCRWLFNKARE
jgi:hypothetical protein